MNETENLEPSLTPGMPTPQPKPKTLEEQLAANEAIVRRLEKDLRTWQKKTGKKMRVRRALLLARWLDKKKQKAEREADRLEQQILRDARVCVYGKTGITWNKDLIAAVEKLVGVRYADAQQLVPGNSPRSSPFEEALRRFRQRVLDRSKVLKKAMAAHSAACDSHQDAVNRHWDLTQDVGWEHRHALYNHRNISDRLRGQIQEKARKKVSAEEREESAKLTAARKTLRDIADGKIQVRW